MVHKFKIGQLVQLARDSVRPPSDGYFKVLALRPPEQGDPHYLIKSDSERHQRIVAQSTLKTPST